ncbi:unnamed protein product, partial [Mesorhabditis belari]|uniref:Mitotic checkpoint protein and poly(A)+ RNA export protein n=1 Tax=Mesorhabditis belari TaxID=2138241 RepID=A0AAF3F3M9_9BILA
MFGNSSPFGAKPLFTSTTAASQQPSEDFVVNGAPEDTISKIKFAPAQDQALLACGSWDGTARIWQVSDSCQSEGKAEQKMPAPILDIEWFDDSSKLFLACADKEVRCWDLASNQVATVGTHDGAIKTCHWITRSQYSCLMTGSWDKTLRFWDMRQLPTQSSLRTIQLPERVFSADVLGPMGAVALANRQIKVYNLENAPEEVKQFESQLKMQSRCLSIFKDRQSDQPTGFALGSIEGRVAVQYVSPRDPKDNFTFKCHRSAEIINGYQEIYPVNDVCLHPTYGTLLTIGSDGRYSMWDKDARTKLKTSETYQMPLTSCHFHPSGNIMALAAGYDWSRGHEFNTQPGSKIVLHKCSEDMKPRPKK